MAAEKDFPEAVQEVFRLMREGPLLLSAEKSNYEVVDDIHAAIEMQQDEGIKKPLRYIIDITEDASGEIDSPPFDERKRKFRELMDEFNYYEALKSYFSKHPLSQELDAEGISDLSEAIYEDLTLCAQARLMMDKSHPYFEKLLSVYKEQGFPCAWKGGSTWKKGDFVIYSLPAND